MVPSFNDGKVIVTGKNGTRKLTVCATGSAGKTRTLVDAAVVNGDRTGPISARVGHVQARALLSEPRRFNWVEAASSATALPHDDRAGPSL